MVSLPGTHQVQRPTAEPSGGLRRPTAMTRRAALTGLAIVSILATACTTSGETVGEGRFTAPSLPDEFASGLRIDFIPDGYTFVWNEGHETAEFHVFQADDGSSQLSVGVQVFPPTHDSGPTEVVIRGERHFDIYDEGEWTRLIEDVGNATRIDVLSNTLDVGTLVRVAESVTYEPPGG
jgi:hypothetical protein